jgi:hypothetical protein
MKQDLTTAIRNTFGELNKVITSFEEEEINAAPFAGSWTPGQVAEHIIKSISNLPAFFADIVPTLRRPDEKISSIENVFLDFTIKMQSPDFIIPSGRDHQKKDLLAAFVKIEKEMTDAVETLDLSATCRGFEFPGWGFLTRLEWIHFFLAHTRRHTHQLKNIHHSLKTLTYDKRN